MKDQNSVDQVKIPDNLVDITLIYKYVDENGTEQVLRGTLTVETLKRPDFVRGAVYKILLYNGETPNLSVFKCFYDVMSAFSAHENKCVKAAIELDVEGVHVPKFVGTEGTPVEDPVTMQFVLEKPLANGSLENTPSSGVLYEFVEAQGFDRFDFADASSFTQTLERMSAFLDAYEEKGFVNIDIKPDAFMVGEDGTVYPIDFDMVMTKDIPSHLAGALGTLHIVHPAIVSENGVENFERAKIAARYAYLGSLFKKVFGVWSSSLGFRSDPIIKIKPREMNAKIIANIFNSYSNLEYADEFYLQQQFLIPGYALLNLYKEMTAEQLKEIESEGVPFILTLIEGKDPEEAEDIMYEIFRLFYDNLTDLLNLTNTNIRDQWKPLKSYSEFTNELNGLIARIAGSASSDMSAVA